MNRELLRRLAPAIISCVGILFFKWGIETFLLYFYLDSLFLIIFAFIKSGLAVQSDSVWADVPYDPKAQPVPGLRYGGLGLLSLSLGVAFFYTYITVGFNSANEISVIWGLAFALVNHGYDLFVFKKTELYKKVTAAFCISAPFKRVIVFFLAAILSAEANYRFAVYALLLCQIVFEFYFWDLEKRHRSGDFRPRTRLGL